jgi:hypothetical protein
VIIPHRNRFLSESTALAAGVSDVEFAPTRPEASAYGSYFVGTPVSP